MTNADTTRTHVLQVSKGVWERHVAAVVAVFGEFNYDGRPVNNIKATNVNSNRKMNTAMHGGHAHGITLHLHALGCCRPPHRLTLNQLMHGTITFTKNTET